jgi:hypothetical protein
MTTLRLSSDPSIIGSRYRPQAGALLCGECQESLEINNESYECCVLTEVVSLFELSQGVIRTKAPKKRHRHRSTSC